MKEQDNDIKKNIIKIYLIENCYRDLNKVYIGKEKSNKKYRNRKQDHIKKFGNSIIFTFIDEIQSNKHKDWKPLESFWIYYFKFLGFEVLNKNEGGGGLQFHTKETKLKISKSKIGNSYAKGRNHTEEAKINIGLNNRKPRSQEFKEKLSKARKGIKHKSSRKGEEHGNFGKKNPKSQECKYKMSKFHLGKKLSNETILKKSKPIIQYDLNMNPIKEWISSKVAGRYYGKKNGVDICNCCRGRQKTSLGFIWKYKE